MIPILKEAVNNALRDSDCLLEQANALHSPGWDKLSQSELICEIECTIKGMLIMPMHSPFDLAKALFDMSELTFSRERDESGLYQWVTTHGSFQLYILANDNIDMTVTIVDLNTTQQ
jgi:hypothetical protein